MITLSIISKDRFVRHVLSLGLAFVGMGGAASAQVAVGTCRPNLIHFDNLDDAVNGVPSGETILVCPGTYSEQISINVSLTLQGVQDGTSALASIVPPLGGLKQNATGLSNIFSFLGNSPIAAQIFVNPGVTVNISNITLDATNNGVPACGPLEPLAILYQDSSGTVNRVDVKNETTPCLNSAGSPNPQGEGVLVQSDGAMPAVVTVEHSAFSNIGLNNIEGDGAGTTITVDNNTIVGPGDTAGNGIYITQAAGAVTNNKISNALHLGETSGFFGIIGECSSAFSATGNEVSNTVLGIYIIDPLTIGGNPPGPCGTTGYTITGNQIFHTSAGPSFGVPGNGIEVCGPNNTIQNNLINDSAQSGIALDPSCGNTANMVSGNRINGACAAVLQSPDSVGNNVIQPNAIFNSKFLLVNGTSCQ